MEIEGVLKSTSSKNKGFISYFTKIQGFANTEPRGVIKNHGVKVAQSVASVWLMFSHLCQPGDDMIAAVKPAVICVADNMTTSVISRPEGALISYVQFSCHKNNSSI